MDRFDPAFAVTLLTFAAAGCAPASEPPLLSEASDEVEGNVVHSQAPVWSEAEAWSVSPEPELVIGVLEGPDEYQLVNVADAGRLSDGRVVLVDRGAQTVRLYGPDGTFRMTLGGPGAGPGEFTDPGSVLVTAGDTMVVWDQSLLRATRFTPSGDLAAVRTVDWGVLAAAVGVEMVSKGGAARGAAAGAKGAGEKAVGVPLGLYPGPIEPLPDGGYLVRLVGKDGPLPGSVRYRPAAGALRVPADFSVIDTLMFFGDTEQVVVEAPWGPFAVTPPAPRETHMVRSGASSRVCIGEQEGPEVSCFGEDGVRTVIRWEGEPLPLPQGKVAAWRDASLRLLDPKLSRDQILEALAQVPVPRFRPPYSRIFLDPAENLWVELAPGGEPSRAEPGRAHDFLVFDPQGHLLGTVPLPPIRILHIGLDHVLGIRQDELEVQYLQLHELRKPLD